MDPNVHLNTHPIEETSLHSLGYCMSKNMMAADKLILHTRGPSDTTTRLDSLPSAVSSDGKSFSLTWQCSGLSTKQREISSSKAEPHSRADKLVAEEMMSLNCCQRDRVYHDIHGIPNLPTNESPVLLHTCLTQLGDELNDLTSVLPSNNNCTGANNIHLRFLRAERFNVERAANRFLSHLQLKNSLLGKDQFDHDITSDDLTEADAVTALHESCIGTCLPECDTAGRFVIHHTYNQSSSSVHSTMKKAYYSMMSYSKDLEVQRRGCVLVLDIPRNTTTTRTTQPPHAQLFEWARQWGAMLSALPLRVEAIHMCSELKDWRPIIGTFKLSCDSFARLRVREHIGSVEEILESLKSFGIPTIPASSTKESVLSFASRVSRHDLEQAEGKQEKVPSRVLPIVTPSVSPSSVEITIAKPKARDILLGRGKSSYNHEGNVRLRSMVSKHADLYEVAPFSEKKKVAADIVHILKATSTRFLKELSDGKWVEVDDETARRKVGHAFRTHRSLTAHSKVGKFMMARQKVREEISQGITIPF